MKQVVTLFLLLGLVQANAQLIEDTPNEAVHFDDAFFIQRAFENENSWARGIISSTINWDKTSNLWDVNRALKSNNDFSMIKFANGGDIAFYTNESTGSTNYTITNSNLSNHLAMKVLATGKVSISKHLGVGASPDDNYRLHVQMPNQNLMRLTNTNPSGGNGAIAFHNHAGEVSRFQFTSEGTFNFQDFNGTDHTTLLKIEETGNAEITGKLGIGGTFSDQHSLRIGKGSQKMIDMYQTGSGDASISLTHPAGEISRIKFGSNGNFSFQKFESGAWVNNMKMNADGHLGIKTNPGSSYVLQVGGNMRAEEIKVEIFNGPDYVFESDYYLRSLEETEAYIKANKHLPEIPSAKQMEENGVQLGEMNMLLLKKIEELTLHTIQQQKTIEEQGKMIQELKRMIQQ